MVCTTYDNNTINKNLKPVTRVKLTERQFLRENTLYKKGSTD